MEPVRRAGSNDRKRLKGFTAAPETDDTAGVTRLIQEFTLGVRYNNVTAMDTFNLVPPGHVNEYFRHVLCAFLAG